MADTGEPAASAPGEGVAPRDTLAPKLRLFLSADVVGSTAYKQRDGADGSNWFTMVSSFYSQASATLRSQWQWFESNLAEDDRAEMLGQAPELWKTIGDEVLFAKEVKSPSQAVMALHVWIETLKGLRKVLQKFDPALDVKSTAWIADFPIRNREIVLGAASDTEDDLDWLNDQQLQECASGKSNLICDYIGPSIDTGFRLSATATSRQLAVSIELAHMLSYEECQPRDKYMIGPAEIAPLQFRYDGRQELKGVLNGASYPQLWIDTAPGEALNKAEDSLLTRAKPRADEIHTFTTAFIEKHANKFCTALPFVRTEPPTAYLAHCESIKQQIFDRERRFQNVEANREARQQSIGSPEADPAQTQLDVTLNLVNEAGSDFSTVSAD